MHCGELNQELGYKAPEASQPLNDFLKALGHKFSGNKHIRSWIFLLGFDLLLSINLIMFL